MLDRVGRALINVVAGIAVVRHLGAGDFGVLSFAISLTGLFTVLAGLGLDDILVRDLADQKRAGGTWRAAWRLRLSAAMLAFFVTIGVACVWRPAEPRVWLITTIVAAGIVFTPAELVDFWFQAKARMKPPAIARQTALWTAAGVRLVLVAANAPLSAFALAAAAEAILVACSLGWLFRQEGWKPANEGGIENHTKRLLREGWPLLASGFLVTVTMQADRLLLGRLANDATVGCYAAAARLTEVLHALPLALGAAAMPRLVTLYREGDGAYWRVAQRIVFGAVLATTGCAAFFSFFSPSIVAFVFGSAYAESAAMLAVHVWTLVFVAMVTLRTRMLVIAAGTRWVLIMSLLTAVLNVAANLMLIPRLGGLGAALAAAGAWAFSAIVAPWLFPVTRRLTLHILRGAGPTGQPIR